MVSGRDSNNTKFLMPTGGNSVFFDLWSQLTVSEPTTGKKKRELRINTFFCISEGWLGIACHLTNNVLMDHVRTGVILVSFSAVISRRIGMDFVPGHQWSRISVSS